MVLKFLVSARNARFLFRRRTNFLKVSGTGDLFFNSFGAIIEIDVEDDLYIDTEPIVAFEVTLSYNDNTTWFASRHKWKSLFSRGEGLFVAFQAEERYDSKQTNEHFFTMGSSVSSRRNF